MVGAFDLLPAALGAAHPRLVAVLLAHRPLLRDLKAHARLLGQLLAEAPPGLLEAYLADRAVLEQAHAALLEEVRRAARATP